jgi:hypothetical protein
MRSMIFLMLVLFSRLGLAAPIEVYVDQSLGAGSFYTSCVFDGNSRSCLLDTGSALTSITNDLFSSSYPIIGQRSESSAAGKPFIFDFIQVRNLSVADSTIVNDRVGLGPVGSDDDTIGIDSFRGKTIVLDPEAKSIDTSTNPISRNSRVFPFTFAPEGQVVMPISISGESELAVWDTGAGLTTVDLTYAQNHPETFDYFGDITLPDGLGNNMILKRYHMLNSIKVGDSEFSGLDVFACDFGPIKPIVGDNVRMLIAYNLLIQAKWYVDMQLREWKIEVPSKM